MYWLFSTYIIFRKDKVIKKLPQLFADKLWTMHQKSETESNNLVNRVKVVFQISVRQKDYQISGTKKIN